VLRRGTLAWHNARMLRRSLIAGAATSLALAPRAWADDFQSFLMRLQARAVAAGIPQDIVRSTTAGLVPNQDVLKFDHHQAEFTETWATYSSHVLSATRIANGQQKAAADATLLAAVTSRYGVAQGPMLGIWGLETNFGANQGEFDVIDALTTLAWDRQSSYFGGQVISAMRIVAIGDAPAEKLLGSYAGAMGQPQFMPSVYLSTAVSFAGTGQPDIWGSDADSLASMAHYLTKAGWQPGAPVAEPVFAPPGFSADGTGRENVQTIGYWQGQGIQRLDGAAPLSPATPCALLMPDGTGGAAYLVFANFRIVRKYNPSDFYALGVSELGRRIVSA
jgi:membrane-bound lytic murein transglycosylase B